jgi:MerR family transcriptional regulator/heat shock protein HspR
MTRQDNDTPIYSIGTAARMLGISVQTLRLYESEGLIITFKTTGNQRLFSDADIERIECIRKAINEDKISIAGIKRIHSMIPCWNIFHCSEEERKALFAFRSHTGGCWTHKNEHSICNERECRLCEVYKLSSNCDQIKEQIYKLGNTLTDQISLPQV